MKRFCQARVTPPTWARTISMPSTARILLDVSTLPCGVLEPVCREKGTGGKGNDEASPGSCMTVLVNGSLPICQCRPHKQLVLPTREAYESSKMELSRGTS